MNKAFIGFLCFLIVLLPIVSALAEASVDTDFPGFRSIFMIMSLDKMIPSGNKTYTMGGYLIVLDEENKMLKFVSFPYNLALTIQTEKGEVTKQLQNTGQELGPDGLVEKLESNFGIEIDHWVMTTLTGLSDFVDVAGGIEVDLPDLSINSHAGNLQYMMSKPYVKVAETGLQLLSGVQAMAYITDTTYGSPTISEEEERFRERHEVLIRGIIKSLGSFQVDVESLATLMVDSMLGNYSTDLKIEDMLALVRMDLSASPQYEQAFLFIPQVISTVKASNGWESLGYTEEDVLMVQAFIGK